MHTRREYLYYFECFNQCNVLCAWSVRAHSPFEAIDILTDCHGVRPVAFHLIPWQLNPRYEPTLDGITFCKHCMGFMPDGEADQNGWCQYCQRFEIAPQRLLYYIEAFDQASAVGEHATQWADSLKDACLIVERQFLNAAAVIPTCFKWLDDEPWFCADQLAKYKLCPNCCAVYDLADPCAECPACREDQGVKSQA